MATDSPAKTFRKIAECAKRDRATVHVRFRLDDGTPREWRCGVGKVSPTGFWTPGHFFVAWANIDDMEGAAA